MEEERVHAEAEASRIEREALEAARQRAEARAQEALEAERREEEERQRRERESATRVEAMARAAEEAARAEVEGRLRAEERDRERRYALDELRLAGEAARGSAPRRVLFAALAGIAGTGALAAACYSGVVRPSERAQEARWSSELASRDALVTDAREEARAASEHARSLEAQMALVRTEADDLHKALDEANRRSTTGSPRAPSVVRVTHGTTRDAPIDGFASCPPGSHDPMCMR